MILKSPAPVGLVDLLKVNRFRTVRDSASRGIARHLSCSGLVLPTRCSERACSMAGGVVGVAVGRLGGGLVTWCRPAIARGRYGHILYNGEATIIASGFSIIQWLQRPLAIAGRHCGHIQLRSVFHGAVV